MGEVKIKEQKQIDMSRRHDNLPISHQEEISLKPLTKKEIIELWLDFPIKEKTIMILKQFNKEF